MGKIDLCNFCKEIKSLKWINNPICYYCYKNLFQPKHVCTWCGELRAVKEWYKDRPRCNSCYKDVYEQSKRACLECKCLSSIYKKRYATLRKVLYETL